MYGLLEKQFAKLYAEASQTRGQSGEAMLKFLELRLDNTIYRAGYATSRRAARQLVSHGHFMVNDRRVDIPSLRVKVGDKIALKPSSFNSGYFKNIDDVSPKPASIPAWLKVDRKKFEVSVAGIPTRDDAEEGINEQLIVEYYSR